MPNLYSNMPHNPGVYIMRDANGEVLYVGKAKDLRKRVSSYFSKTPKDIKTRELVPRIASIEPMVVASEVEALILENEQIKKYRPPYNVLMRDDKYYLYIRLTVQEEFPRILLARRVVKDGAKYFGPYIDSKSLYEVIRILKKIFPVCGHTGEITTEKLAKKRIRACLNYHIGICPGVCLGKVSSAEYHKTFDRIVAFLKGDYEGVMSDLQSRMVIASQEKGFEEAARLRDSIHAIERISQKQVVISTDLSSCEDVIGIARQMNKAVVSLMEIRGGKLTNQQHFAMGSRYESTEEEILESFLEEYYPNAVDSPKTVVLPIPLESSDLISKWLSHMFGHKVAVMAPARGRLKELSKIATLNAEVKFTSLASKWNLENVVKTEGPAKLAELLKMETINRIEAYDISNTQGSDSVGSMVVYEEGKMNKDQYRRFKIKNVEGPNDFASLAEMLTRRFSHDTEDTRFARKPDLVLIDGGKGQVNTVAKALKGTDVRIIGIAKGVHGPNSKDDIVFPFTSKLVILPEGSPAKVLLQTIRDEAHRFALGYHTILRKKKMETSKLDQITGVGPTTKKKLLQKFGSVRSIASASPADLAAIVGEKKAEEILKNLK